MTRTIFTLLMLVFTFGHLNAQEDGYSMSELLRQIEQGQARDSIAAQNREKRFQVARNEQQRLLNNSRAERKREEDQYRKIVSLLDINFRA